MLLWDEEMRQVLPQIEDLTAAQRFTLSVQVIKHVLAFDGAFIDEMEEETADFVRRSLGQADEAVAAGLLSVPVPEGIEDEVNGILDADEAGGVEPLLMAVVNLFGYAESGMGAAHVFDVLSSGYQSVLERQEDDVQTADDERANPDLVRVIEEQKELVRSAPAR